MEATSSECVQQFDRNTGGKSEEPTVPEDHNGNITFEEALERKRRRKLLEFRKYLVETRVVQVLAQREFAPHRARGTLPHLRFWAVIQRGSYISYDRWCKANVLIVGRRVHSQCF